MRPTLVGAGLRVLEKSFGRAARDCSEVVNQVRLVVVAALERDPRPVARLGPFGALARPLEPDQPRGRLRRQPDLLAEANDDPLAAPAELRGERSDPRATAGIDEPLPGPGDLARRRRRIAQPAGKH